jgi:hypothetical protein
MMYKNSLKILAASLLLLSGACDNGFEELNIDPNNPTSIPTASLFTSAQRSLVQELYGAQGETGLSTDATIYMQYWTPLRGGGNGIYTTVEQDFSDLYTEGIQDLNEIIRLNAEPATAVRAAESGSNANQIAVARILKAWTFQNITDIWGDIPYFQALQGTAQVLPAYTPQGEIYADLVKELDEATAQINVNEPGIKGDIIYGGNMANWKMFAQSLKMRLGMRLSEIDPASAQKAVGEAYQAGLLQSNSQNALYKYLAASPNNNPWFYHFYVQVPGYGVANTLIDKLKALNDPRLSVYADPAQLGGGYIGRQFGLDNATAASQRDEATSWPSKANVLSATTPFVLLSYDEVLLLQAEAAARGWIQGDPAAFYQAGISASMQYWGVQPAAIAAYLAQPQVAYQAANPLESIGEQKWLALYNRGLEAWAEWRRLDYPVLQSASQAFAGRSLPRRRGYPTSEISLNQANYREAVKRQGPDELSTRVWWDK